MRVADGCSKRRPDFILKYPWGTLVLEIDEFQHNRNTYTCECELTRMRQIYFDVGESNLLFVRYNPDSYIPLSGKKLSTKQRQEFLLDLLKQQTQHSGLAVIYLFYDGFIFPPEKERIDPYA